MKDPLRDWLLYLPIAKAVQAADGRLEVEGIASDESVDLENEIVKASGLVDTLRILEERGVIDWDHGRIIGAIDKAAIIPVEEAIERFPELREWYGRDYAGRRVFYLHGWVDAPLPDEDEPDNQDLLDARHTLKAGHRLGFSVSGGRLRRGQTQGPDGRIYPSTEQAVLTRVALTPHPINLNTVARMAKSLSAAMSEPEGDGPVVVIAKGMEGLSAGAGTDHAGFGGGRSLVPESLHDRVEDTLWGCATCKTSRRAPDADGPPRCRVCGGEMARTGRSEVRKGLSPLARIAHDLGAPEEDATMSGELTRARKLHKSVFGSLARIFGKAADMDEDDLEDIEGEVKDLAEAVGEAGEGLPPDGEGLPEDGAPEAPEDLALGEEDTSDEPPSEGEVDDILAELDDADEAVPDLYETTQEDVEAGTQDEDDDDDDEDDDEFEEAGIVRKSLAQYIAEKEGGAEALEVIEADDLLAGLLEGLQKALDDRFETLEAALAESLEGQAAMAEGLSAMHKSIGASSEELALLRTVQEQRKRALGAVPAGTRIRKSAKDGAAAVEPEELVDRIQKGLQEGLLDVGEANTMNVRLRRGDLEGVEADLATIGA